MIQEKLRAISNPHCYQCRIHGVPWGSPEPQWGTPLVAQNWSYILQGKQTPHELVFLGCRQVILVSNYLVGLLEKAMATHSSTLAWKIPWTKEPGRLQSMGSLRATSLSLFTFMHWRRKWQPTPGFLPGESQGQGSLVGCRLWGRTESDPTEAT